MPAAVEEAEEEAEEVLEAEAAAAEAAEVLEAEPVEAPVVELEAEPAEAPAVELEEAMAAEPEVVADSAKAESVDRRAHSEADWIRATRSRRRNPLPASAARVRTMRQEVLPGGCSPHINACPLRRFRIPTG